MSNKIYFTPGPSQLYHTFNDHFREAIKNDVPSISHRSAAFIKIVEESTEALKALFNLPDNYHVFFLNSANEAWDRIVQNLVEISSHHFANGSFSKKFHDFALMQGKASTVNLVNDGSSYLDLKIPEDSELVGICKNDTSVGYTFTEEEMAEIRQQNPDKLIALDVVTAAPVLPVDFSLVDTAYLSVQKAFGMPAGLGVWMVNDRCIEKAAKKATKSNIGSYRSVLNLKKFSDKYQTPETPNMLFIYIIGKIAQDFLNYGAERMRNDIVYKSAIIHQVIEAHPALNHFVESEKHRSKSTIVVNTTNQKAFLDQLLENGLVLGTGYGPHKKDHLRIANFPAHSRESVELLCDIMQNIG
ncbi:MAG: aminotransferase class V-fold PLP-dependent enzyme [Bacteroidota bacterium]